jgi:phenylpropionate dioxygenase-like ring-hydroxylating dioxygenase large terminal subunit
MPSDKTPMTWPAEGVSRVPYEVFDDPELYAREQAAIFRGPTWNYLGLDCEIPNPGDYRLTWVGEAPVILCRDREGEVQAMVNRCSHRGSLLCITNRGNRKVFTCAYHNWSFDLGGKLVGVPFAKGARGQGGMPADFDPSKHGLERLRVATYRGIHFGTFSEKTPPLETYLGPVMRVYLDRIYNRPMRVIGQYSQLLKNNWKLVIENQRDPYHANIMHLFFVTFGLARLTMKGEALMDDTGGHHAVYMKRATDDIRGSEYEGDTILNMKARMTLNDPKLLEQFTEWGDGVSSVIQTVFPNIVFQQITNCIATRLIVPRGPNESEFFWTLLGYEDDEEWKTKIRARQSNMIGPAGLASMEDGAVTNFVQRAIQGRSPGTTAVVELGGRDVASSDNRVTEACIRGYWKAYREMMGL